MDTDSGGPHHPPGDRPAGGQAALAATWTCPKGLPAGFEPWARFWIQDPTGAAGLSASNALVATPTLLEARASDT